MSGETKTLVERLRARRRVRLQYFGRSVGAWPPNYSEQTDQPDPDCKEAADEIERLERELADARRERDESDAVIAWQWGEDIKSGRETFHVNRGKALARHRAAQEKE